MSNSRLLLSYIDSKNCLLGRSLLTGERDGPCLNFLLTSDFRVDCSQIGLRDLRSKIAIIPQEPVLFQGRWYLFSLYC